MTHTKSASRRKSALTVALVAVLVLVGPAAGSVAAGAPPEPPHRFFGTVTDQNDDPVDGVTVEVYYQGEVVASDTTDSEGYYDLKVPAESIDTEESTEITLTAESTSVDETWEAGGSTELDFEVTVEETPVDTPTPEPPDSGDGDDGDTGDGDTGDGDDGGQAGGGQPGGGQQPDDTPTATPPETATPTEDETPPETVTPTEDETPPETATPTEDETPPETATPTDSPTPPETTTTDSPGFGVGVSLVALAAAALLGFRRSD